MIITTISALPFSASAEPTESSYTVTFTPNENFNWENVYFYCDSGDYAWPGVKMTQSGSNYTVAINTTSVPALFILNNGSGKQTNDIEFKSDGSKIDVTTIGTCTITAVPKYYVVGNGSGNWLNGVEWEPGNSANQMTEISDNVWQIVYEDVPAGLNCIFKFVADGSFQTNFGGTLSANGIYEDAVYNAYENITFTTTETSNVIIILDLSDYDHSSKQGAKFTVIYETVEITYTLYDSYGDGWNNNSLVIKDMTNNRDFATLTMNSAAFEQPGSIILIKGHTYNFIWNTGNYSDECGIILKNGDEILVSYPSMVNIPNGTVLLEYTAGLKIEKYNLWVGGTQVTSANAEDVFGNGTVKYNDDTKTLTLNNFTFEGAGYNYSDSDYYGAGIYCYNNKNEITLELIGTNTIKETNGSNGSSALRFTGSLKITGSGTLKAISCDTNGGYSYGIDVHGNLTIPEDFTGVINATSGNGEGGAFAYGIQCWGIIDISDGTINATSGTGQRTYGIECENLIVNGGTINATSGDTTNSSNALTYGIKAKMSFIINSGAVTAKSGKTANKDYCWSYGLSAIYVYINGGTVITSSDYAASGSNAVYYEKDYGSINIADSLIATASENNDGSNAVAYNKNNNDNYKWFKSEPIPPHVHNHTPVITNPTCTEQGYTTWTCTCGDSYVDTYKDALGHDFGVNEKTCTRCGIANPNYVEPTPEPQPEPAPVLTPEEAAMPTETATAKLIKKTNTDKYDVVGSEYKRLQPRATAKKQSITLKWKKVGGANGYIIYGALCGQPMKPIKTITNPNTVKTTFRSLKKGKYYKYIVSAYKNTADGKRIISKSKSVHCCTDGGKKGNPTKLTLKKSKLTVKKGKSVKISGTVSGKKKISVHIAKARFESSNTSTATVDKNGKVKGKKKGTATIYVYAQNGLCKTVKVKVK